LVSEAINYMPLCSKDIDYQKVSTFFWTPLYIPLGGWCGRPGIWMIHIVEEIKLLLLLGNRLVIVGQTYPRKHIRGNYRNECMCMFQNNSGTPRAISAKLGIHMTIRLG
jgi:hypothetical protein